MGRQVINCICCSQCGREFNVATEDIEWEHLQDIGEADDGTSIRDYGLFQKVTCPFCNADQKIVFAAKGRDESHIEKMTVVSLEIDK